MQTCSGDEDGNSSEPVEEEGGNVKAEGYLAFSKKVFETKVFAGASYKCTAQQYL